MSTAPPRRPRPVPHPPRVRAAKALRLAPLLAAAALIAPRLASPPPLAAAHYSQGEHIQFIGVVADSQGRPLTGVRVVLEASRSYFSLRELRRAEKDVRRVSAESDAKGEYSIDWPWDGYYNRFKLLAAVAVRKGKEETLHLLDSIEVTDRLAAGAPVVSTLEVKDRGFVDRLREFLASIQSEDQRRVFQDMGTPDDVKRVNYSGTPPAVEISWWYFEAGKVYRFRDGRLEQTSDFAPVKGFSTPPAAED